jgi:ABC-type branched-subunit amino acid transport system ATPase component
MNSIDQALKVEDLTVRFGNLVALRNVALGVDSRSVTALIGPNGAGKTTLLNAISGFLRPHAGEIWVGERNLSARAAHDRTFLGVRRTFQHARLTEELTVLENVLVGASDQNYPWSLIGEWVRLPKETARLSAQRQKALGILEKLDIADIADIVVSSLSFGRKKLVDLARAIMATPSVLLMDEPTAGLSEEEIGRLTTMISELKGSMTILVVAHHMGFVSRISDQVVCLVSGEVISSGTAKEVQSDPKVLAAYMGT